MEVSQPIMVLQEVIVGEASDDEETPKHISMRVQMGKWIPKETSTMVELPNGITQETTVITEDFGRSNKNMRPVIAVDPTPRIDIQVVGEPNRGREYDLDYDLRILEHVERVGIAEDTVSILVDG